MTTVAVTCARDEIDLIEPFVRHTLWYADRLIVLDNGSTDGTCEVLKALREEGLPLDVVADPSPGKHLSRRMTRLMCEYAVGRYGADWVLPLDADEFVCVRDEGLLIPEGTALDRPLQLSWRNYVPAEDDDPAERNPVIRLRHRLTNKDRPVVKVVVPGELARRPGAVITTGSHTLEVEGRECPGVEVHHAYLAHFPVRTPGQFVAKTVIGFLQNELVLGRNPCHRFHHRENYELLKRDPAGFVRDFARAVRHYTGRLPGGADPAIVVEPFPYRGGPLRYTPEGDDAVRTWKPILEYAQDWLGSTAFCARP